MKRRDEELKEESKRLWEEMKRMREESEKRNEEFKRNFEAVQAEIRSTIMRYSMSLEDEAKAALEWKLMPWLLGKNQGTRESLRG